MPRRTRQTNRRGGKSKTSIRDPTFTHTMSGYVTIPVTSSLSTVSTVTATILGGFPQLATFFEFVQPIRYRILPSYTNWNGTLAFVPTNPQSAVIPSATSIDTLSLLEVRGAVRMQPGYNNIGTWNTYPYSLLGFSADSLFTTGLPFGYIVAVNDAVAPGSWVVQMSFEVDLKWYRRQLRFFSISPTLVADREQHQAKQALAEEALQEKSDLMSEEY
jgi:hypothetical protein